MSHHRLILIGDGTNMLPGPSLARCSISQPKTSVARQILNTDAGGHPTEPSLAALPSTRECTSRTSRQDSSLTACFICSGGSRVACVPRPPGSVCPRGDLKSKPGGALFPRPRREAEGQALLGLRLWPKKRLQDADGRGGSPRG